MSPFSFIFLAIYTCPIMKEKLTFISLRRFITMLFKTKFEVVEIHQSGACVTNYLYGKKNDVKKDVEHFKNIYLPFEFMCAFISSVQLSSEIHIFFLFIFKRFCFQCLRDTMIYSQTHTHTQTYAPTVFSSLWFAICSCKIYFHISPKILSNWVCHFFFPFSFFCLCWYLECCFVSWDLLILTVFSSDVCNAFNI